MTAGFWRTFLGNRARKASGAGEDTEMRGAVLFRSGHWGRQPFPSSPRQQVLGSNAAGIEEGKRSSSLGHCQVVVLVMLSLSAVSGAPRHATLRSGLLPDGALLIQRLEGSRPHGRLCALNRS